MSPLARNLAQAAHVAALVLRGLARGAARGPLLPKLGMTVLLIVLLLPFWAALEWALALEPELQWSARFIRALFGLRILLEIVHIWCLSDWGEDDDPPEDRAEDPLPPPPSFSRAPSTRRTARWRRRVPI